MTPPAVMHDERTRQNALDGLKILDTPPEERFDRITRLAQQLFGVETAAITLIDHDRQWFKSKVGIDASEIKRGDSFCDFTIRKPEVMEVSDATKDPRFAHNPYVLGNPNIRFYAGYPLETPTGEHVGAFCVFDPHPRTLSSEEKALLKDLGSWAEKEMMIDAELKRAAEVQRGLLPKERAGLDGYEFAGGCASARSVGGDFYDWYEVGGGEVFTLVDVMGKGMAAAIIAATVRAVLRAGSRSGDLAKSVEIAAITLSADLDNAGSFATLFHARLNRETGVVSYVDAGHGLSFVISDIGEATRLTSEFPPLGAGINTEWKEQSFTLNPGDTMVAISDGVLDLFGGTIDGLRSAEEMVRKATSAQALVDDLLRMAGTNSPDDVTILVLHRLKTTEGTKI